MTTYLSPTEAAAWFDAALAALSAHADRDRWAWVLDAARHVRSSLVLRKRAIVDLRNAAAHNFRFGTPESLRDARILCFCATVLRALEVKR